MLKLLENLRNTEALDQVKNKLMDELERMDIFSNSQDYKRDSDISR